MAQYLLLPKTDENKMEMPCLKTIDRYIDTPYKMSIELDGLKIEGILPIRRYGEFRKLMKDRRLKETRTEDEENAGAEIKAGLFWWLKAEKEDKSKPTFDFERIRKELAYYDLHRHKVLEAVFEFERIGYSKGIVTDSAKKPKEEDGGGQIELEPYLKNLKGRGVALPHGLSERQIELLRNKFLHNQIYFDTENNLNNSVLETKGNLITEKLIEFAIDVFQKLVAECVRLSSVCP